MARLVVAGDWVGPGERRLAAILQEGLPEDWTVIAGKKLDDADRSDVDFIVIGDQLVFLLEEKSWQGTVVINQGDWELHPGSRLRANPLNSVKHKARVLRGMINSREGLRDFVTDQRPIHGYVVMSDPGVRIMRGQNVNQLTDVFSASEICAELLKFDERAQTELVRVRGGLVQFLSDLPAVDSQLRQIGDYKVVKLLPAPIEHGFACEAEHVYTGRLVHLRCFPQFTSQDRDPKVFLRREVEALRIVEEANRTWRVEPPFEYDPRNWFCIPSEVPSGNRTLTRSVTSNDPRRESGQIDGETFAQVAADAFAALAVVHEAHIVHRALSPERIWLGPQMRVIFGDFGLAHIDEERTVHAWLNDDAVSRPYRGPECEGTPALATQASDVFALTMCLIAWRAGTLGLAWEAAVDFLDQWPGETDLLKTCLELDPRRRPTAKVVAEGLEEARTADARSELPAEDEVEVPVALAPGFLLAQRYEIQRQLGRGGLASTWLAFDKDRLCNVVIKLLHSSQLYEHALREYNAAGRVRHVRFARAVDVQSRPTPGFLVYEYVAGDVLSEYAPLQTADVESLRRISVQLFELLAYLASNNLVHGDVSPGNIIVDEHGPNLIDFGLLTSSGEVLAGAHRTFSAPEVLARQPATSASDMYSAASSIVQVALGRLPFDVTPETGARSLVMPTDEERSMWGEEGAAIFEVLFACIADDPSDRPQNADAVSQRLSDAHAQPVLVDDETPRVNPTVDAIRSYYRGSAIGNSANRGLETDFARDTYVETRLDRELVTAVLAGSLSFVALTGNPGDGKTAFLKKLEGTLESKGARFELRTSSRWHAVLEGRTYYGLLDASASDGALDSDESLHQALRHLGDDSVVLIAANDGRLQTFFSRFAHIYAQISDSVEAAADGSEPPHRRIAIVDLKSRALVGLNGGGLVADLTESWTSDALWTTCGGCSLAGQCTILASRTAIKAGGVKAIARLMLTSHLRAVRRATIRDFKSALSWMLTGDQGCKDMEDQVLGMRERDSRVALNLHDLAFSEFANDRLLEEWRTLDPGEVVSPAADQAYQLARGMESSKSLLAGGVSGYKRGLFFGDTEGSEVDPHAVEMYRHLSEYSEMLQSPSPHNLKRLLRGISRLAGAHGYAGDGLAVSDQESREAWVFLKVIDETGFELLTRPQDPRFVECIPERLSLHHAGTHSTLVITLDMAELILRAADGEVTNDEGIETYLQELHSFATKVSRKPAQSGTLVDAASTSYRVVAAGGMIELVLQDAT